MSLTHGRTAPSTKARGSSRLGGSRLQTRESTIVSEAYSESYQVSASVQSGRLVQNSSSSRDPILNRVCIARRVNRPEKKKSPSNSPDLVTKEAIAKSEPDRKSVSRLRGEVSSNPLKNYVFVGNGYQPESSAGKPICSSRTRVVHSPKSKTESLASKMRVQDGWIRRSPSPLVARSEMLRKSGTHRETRNVDSVDLKRAGRFTRTEDSALSLREIKEPPAQVDLPLVSQNEDDSKRDYTTECAVSAWLLQCNNASLMLDEKDDTNRVVIVKEIAEDSGNAIPNTTEMETKPTEPVPCGELPSTSVRDLSTQRNSFFPHPVPNKLVHSGIFVKSAVCSDVRRLYDPTGTPITVDGSGLSNVPLDPRATIDLCTTSERESSIRNEGNSVLAQDWTSVSSSEWGDEMCEFDRQQSLRVRKMFEEIDRMLFDATTVDTGPPSAPSSNCKARTTDSSNLENRTSNRSHFDELPEELDFNLKHLKGECQDWLSRFPHLRVCGKQILPPQETGFQFYASTKTGPKFSSGKKNNTKTNGLKAQRGTDLDHVSRAIRNGGAVTSHSASGKGDPLTPRNSPTRSDLNMQGAEEEEIFAIHGEYEEVIAIDKESDSHPSSKHRQGSRDGCGMEKSVRRPPDPEQYLHAADETFATMSRKNDVSKTLLDLLTKEISQDLLDWLQKLTSGEKLSQTVPNPAVSDGSLAPSLSQNMTRESSLVPAGRVRADGHAHSSRAPRDLSHINRGIPEESGLRSTTPDPDSGFTNLSGLLQISTKTLQQREKGSPHDAPEFASRIGDQPGPLNAPASNLNCPSQISRLSPQPTLYPVTVVTGRSFSSIHPKVTLNSSRKVIPGGIQTTTDSISSATSSAPSVVGVAASFHPIGRLAPLERVRTPNGSRVTSHPDESMTYGIDISSHAVHRSKNLLGSNAHNITTSQTIPSQQHINALISPTQPTFGSPNAVAVSADHVSSRGSCTLPPLGTGAVTSGMIQGAANATLTNVSSLLNPPKIGPVSGRLGQVSMQPISHLQLSSTIAPPPASQPSPPTSQSIPPGQSVASHIGSSHSHAPALRGTSANLVTQQINNSGLLLTNHSHKSWQRKPRTTRVKQNLAPSPCHWTRKASKTWRPQTSIPSEKDPPVICLPDLFDRSASTLLIRRIVAGDALSECCSPRKVHSQHSDRIESKIGGSR
ncbi:hypothetical protein D915_004429 [Fasciola hepatica]|uniref:DUF3719 domain-containing protein n=1 Tax=Fasciola hepatica TaxID=6192 RepID=A0A4E0RB98_FASHE|nr:hypothetical protein D915_004429 [Fasciola hepatica]